MAHPKLYPTEEHHAFYYFLGEAVSHWAHVEHGLSLIAWRCFGSPNVTPLMTSFYAIENFRSKLGFVDSAFKLSQFQKQYDTDWVKLRESVRSLGDERNRLAHRSLVIYPHAKEGRRYALIPPPTKFIGQRLTHKCAPSGSLYVTEIELAARRFSMVWMRLQGLYFRLGGEEDPLAIPAQQEPQPRTLDDLRLQIESVSALRDQTSPA